MLLNQIQAVLQKSTIGFADMRLVMPMGSSLR